MRRLYTAIAAACGSLVGAAATIVTTWMTQRTRTTPSRKREENPRSRKALHGEFITEASRLTVDALSNSLKKPETFVKLYGILGRIRLVADGTVGMVAGRSMLVAASLTFTPNRT